MSSQRKKRNRKYLKTENPMIYLSLKILEQAFSDMECYCTDKGTQKQKYNGHIAILWLRKKDGTYPLIQKTIAGMEDGIETELIDEWVDRRIKNICNLSYRKEKNNVI
jgi:hypothetical protein